MKKKQKFYLVIASLITLIIVFTAVLVIRNNPTKSKSFFQNTIPLVGNQKGQITEKKLTIYPPTNPSQTNYKQVQANIPDEISEIEKDKIIGGLPIRIENLSTGTKINTTINVFSLPSDPLQSIRIEIYGPNYNNIGLLSEDAKAFKYSFEEIKKTFKLRDVNLKNLQIIFGNRQYIQDTANIWVKEFKLLEQ